jgi:hypothetical protein
MPGGNPSEDGGCARHLEGFRNCSVPGGTTTVDLVMSDGLVTNSELCAKRLIRAVGLGARDHLLAYLPAQRQPDTDIKLCVNEGVEG